VQGMRKRLVVFAAAGVWAAVAGSIAVADLKDNFGTHLQGRYEVPIRDSQAQGQAIFRVSDDGQSIEYKLIASNIDNPFMAHIHMGGPTVAGPVVQWLYPGTSPPAAPAGSGRHDGVLAEGTFTAATFVGRSRDSRCRLCSTRSATATRTSTCTRATASTATTPDRAISPPARSAANWATRARVHGRRGYAAPLTSLRLRELLPKAYQSRAVGAPRA